MKNTVKKFDRMSKDSKLNKSATQERRPNKATTTTTARKANQQKITQKKKPNFTSGYYPGSESSFMKDAYAMCRLHPFGTHGPVVGIPDGTETRRVLVDHRMMNTITFGSSGVLNIAITPTVPNSIWLNTGMVADTTWKLNGQSFSQNSGVGNVFVPICQPEWSSLSIARYATAGVFNTLGTLYSSMTFRIVSVGWAVTYIGSSMSNSGAMMITNAKLGANVPNSNAGTFQVYSANSGTNSNTTTEEVMVLGQEQQLQFGIPSSGSFTTSLYQGAHGILRHSTPDFKYRDLYSNESYLSVAGNSILSTLMNVGGVNPSTIGQCGVLLGMDSDWDTTLISITGATSGQSIILDTIYCIEYTPSPGSNVYALTQPAPESKPRLMEAVANKARKLPIASSGGITSAANSLMDVMSTAAMVVGMVAK
jgi:hypothetical protein